MKHNPQQSKCKIKLTKKLTKRTKKNDSGKSTKSCELDYANKITKSKAKQKNLQNSIIKLTQC